MISSLSTRHLRGWAQALATFGIACGTATSQNFSLQVADPNPLRIGGFVPSSMDLLESTGGIESGLKGAFAFNAGLETIYDSNFFLSENDEESEVSLLFSPSVNYTSDPEGGAFFSLMANYSPTFRAFLENSDLNDLDHSGDVVMTLSGSRTEVSFFGRYNELSGTDRLTGNFVSGQVFSGGVRATREIATRTSINGGLSYSQSDYSSGETEGATIFSTYFGGLWRATERIGLGSTLRYTQSESDNSGTRDAWALLAEARYRAGERIWLSASLGPEFSKDSETDDDTVNLRADLECRYVINERWSWLNSLNTATVPSPSTAGYVVNNYGFVTELEHQLLRATVRGGVELNYTEYQTVGNVTENRDNEENLSLFLSYNRNFFNERMAFDSTVRYSVNNGDEDWNQWQVSLGLSIPF
jgi:hypothetical protein